MRVSKHDGDESWKHNRVPFPFWCFHEYTHARSHVFVETHPECRDVWAPCVQMWKHIFNTYIWSLCGNTYEFTCSESIKPRNTCAKPLCSSLNNRKHMRKIHAQPSKIPPETNQNHHKSTRNPPQIHQSPTLKTSTAPSIFPARRLLRASLVASHASLLKSSRLSQWRNAVRRNLSAFQKKAGLISWANKKKYHLVI